MILLILPLFPYSLLWKKKLTLSFENIFQIHIPSLLKNLSMASHFTQNKSQNSFDGLWSPTWSDLLLPLIPYFLWFSLFLPCSPTQSTLASHWSWNILNTFLSPSICSYLEHCSSRYLCDFLPHISKISTKITPYNRDLLPWPVFPRKQSLRQRIECR